MLFTAVDFHLISFSRQWNSGTWQCGHMNLKMISTGVCAEILSGCVSVCLHSTHHVRASPA